MNPLLILLFKSFKFFFFNLMLVLLIGNESDKAQTFFFFFRQRVSVHTCRNKTVLKPVLLRGE